MGHERHKLSPTPHRTPPVRAWGRVLCRALAGALALGAVCAAHAQDVLLVDDSFNEFNERAAYAGALDTLGVSYDVWSVSLKGEPDAGSLSDYRAVVWFSGANAQAPGPGREAEDALAAYLDNGGRLFVDSQLWHRVAGTTTFMRQYLGLIGFGLPFSDDTVLGDGPFDGLGPYALACPRNFRLSPASMIPGPNAEAAFRWGSPTTPIAVSNEAGAYRTVYAAFPLECVTAVGHRTAVLGRAMSYFGVNVNPPSGGSPDPFEPNDTSDTATVAPMGTEALGVPEQKHSLHFAGDTDWFRLLANPDGQYRFTIEITQGQEQIAFELLDAELNVLQRVVSGDLRTLVISGRGLSGEHFLRVTSITGGPKSLPTDYVARNLFISAHDGQVTGFVLDALTCSPLQGIPVKIVRTDVGLLSQLAPEGFYWLQENAGDVVDISAAEGLASYHTTMVHAYEMQDANQSAVLDLPVLPVIIDRGLELPDIDEDGDGMDDLKEEKYGLDPESTVDGCLDPDGDGYPNIHELQKGTDPNNPKSNEKTMTVLLTILQMLLEDDEDRGGAPVR